MTSEQLSLFFFRQPFQPFKMYLIDGRQLAIRHPDFATIAKAGLGVWFFDSTGELEIIDTALISSMCTIGPADLDQFAR